MARPVKEGLDYFELDCHMDEKIRLIQAEFGLKGFAVVVLLFMEIYGGKGYYMSWNEDALLLFALHNCGSAGDNKNLIQEIVTACIKRDIFSKELFEKYQILTSSGIQKRYINAVARRENVNLKKEYLLVSDNKKTVNVNKNAVNVNRNSKNDGNNTQSREEKIRVTNNAVGINTLSSISPVPELTEQQLQQIIDAWNSIPNAYKVKRIAPMTRTYDELRICVSVHGMDGILKAIENAKAADWMQRKDKIMFDHFMNRNAIQKLLNGDYNEDFSKKKKQADPNNTKFNNFHQRDYDFNELEKMLFQKQNEQKG